MYGQPPQKVAPKPKATPMPDDDREIGIDEWDDMVADRFKVPRSLMKSVRMQESGGNVNAKSPTGVRGRYQVTEATAKQYGLDRNDQWQQSVAAAKHLRKMYEETDGADDDEKWLGAVGKYYGGSGAVKNGVLSGGSVDGVSNPAEHVRRVAEKWGQYRREEGGQPAAKKEQRRQNIVSLQNELTATSPQVKPGNTLNVTTGRQHPTPPPPPFQSPIDMRLNAPNEAQKAFARAAAATQPATQPKPQLRTKQTLGQIRQQARSLPLITQEDILRNPITPEERKASSEQFIAEQALEKQRQQAAAKARLEEEASRASQSTLGKMGTRFARGAVRGVTQTPFEFVQMANPDPVVRQTMGRIADDSKEWQSQNLPVDNRNPATLNVFKPEFYSLENVGKAATENIPEVLGEMLPQMALARGAGSAARLAAPELAAATIPRMASTTGAQLAARTAAGGYGAMQQSTQAYQKAIAAGMTHEQAQRAAAIEAPIGFSEFLGSPGTTGFTRPGGTILREMREEGLQELGQTAASGLAGKYASGYDADKSLTDIAGESLGSGLLGAATGGIVAAPGARLQARQQANQQRAARSAIDQRSAANAAAITPQPAQAQPVTEPLTEPLAAQPSAPVTPQAQPQGFPRLPEPENFNARRAKLLGMPVPAEVGLNEQIAAAAQLLDSTNEGDQRQGRRMLNKALTDLRKVEGYLAEAQMPPDAERPFTAVRDAIEARLKPAPKVKEVTANQVPSSSAGEVATPTASNALRAEADAAKIKAAEFERVGDFTQAAATYQAAHQNLKRLRRSMGQPKTPEAVAQINQIDREISIADANRRKANQAARTAQRQANAPTTPLSKELSKSQKPNAQVPLNQVVESAPLPAQSFDEIVADVDAEPTNRLREAEYEGGEMQRYSKPLEGQEVERDAEFQPDTADLREVREFAKREPRAEQFTEEPPTAPLARRRQPIRPPAPASPRQVGNRPLSVDVAGTRTPVAMSPEFPRARREMVRQGREVEARLTEGQDKGEFGNVAEAMFKSNTPDVLHGQDSFFHDPDLKGKLGLTRDAEMADVRRELKTQLARSLGLSADEVSLSHIKPEIWRAWAKQKGLGREAVRKLEAGIARAERKQRATETNSAIVAEESQRAQSEVQESAAKTGKSIDAQIKDIRDLQKFDLIDDKEAKRQIAALEAQRPKAREQKTRADVESSPEFKRWFGDSKVVDENGKPLVVYHGTDKDIEAFQDRAGRHGQFFGKGHYFAPRPSGAESFAYGEGANIVPSYLSIKNPLTVTTGTSEFHQAFALEDPAAITNAARSKGHDGIIIISSRTGKPSEIIAFSPNQIKSAIGNRGTFDPDSPRILEQQSQPVTADSILSDARIQFKPGKRGQAGTLYADENALRVLRIAYEHVFGNRVEFNNVNLNQAASRKMVAMLHEEADSPEYEPALQRKLREVAREMTRAWQTGDTVSIVSTGADGRKFSDIKVSRRHELFHDAQEGLENSPGFLAKHKYSKQLIEGLANYSFEDRTVEAAAFIAGGQAKEFGLTDAQGKEFLKDYFDDIVANNGREALERFVSLAPKVQDALKEARQQYDVQGKTRTGSSERKPGTNRRTGTIGETARRGESISRSAREQKRLAFSVGRVPEGRGQVLASGLNVQGLFDRTPKPAKDAKPVPLPRSFNLADWSQKLYRDAMAAGLPKDARAKYDAAKTIREKNAILMEAKPDDAREAKIFDLIDRAQAAAEKNDGSALYDVLSDATDLLSKTPERGLKRVGQEVGNLVSLPRAVMASADVSAPLRQGAILTLPPSQWGKAAKATVRMFQAFNTAKYKEITKRINLHEDAETARESGLYLSTDKSGLLLKKEEDFISSWADKIPIVKHSEQAYKTYLDSLRMDSFARYKKSIDKTKGLTEEQKQKAYQAAAEWINTATGRGSLGSHFESAMPILSKTLFAPRYAASRIQILNPYTYAKNLRTPEGRVVLRNQMSDMVQYAGMVSLTLALASAAGATVGLDPEDPDFLKIKVGHTRYDALAGLQQPMRLFYRIGDALRRRVTGEKAASRQTALDITARYGRSKLAPVPSFFLDYVTGKDFVGRDFEMKRAVLDRVTPLMWKDAADAYEKEGGAGATKILPAMFGIGVQNYAEKTGSLKESQFTDAAEKYGKEYDFIRPKVGEPEAIYKQRVQRVEGWMSEYGDKLLSHPSYSLLTESQKQAAIENLRRRIGTQQNKREPKRDLLGNIESFAPEKVIQSVLKSEATRPKRDAGKLWVAPTR